MTIVIPGEKSPFADSNQSGNYIIIRRGFLLGSYDDYHERVNDWIMKRKPVKKVYVD